MIYQLSFWPSLKSVFEKALNDRKIEPFILAHPVLDQRVTSRGKNECYDHFIKLYPHNVINLKENGKSFDLEAFGIDYVFYTTPYSYLYFPEFQIQNLKKIAKICWITYGYTVTNGPIIRYSHNYDFMADTSFTFPPNRTFENMYKEKLKIFNSKYPNLDFAGFPRFELITQAPKNISPSIILWTPRWCDPKGQKDNFPSNFFILKDILLDFAKNHKNVKLIVRPHPLMFGDFVKKGIMSENEVDIFKEQCENTENIVLDLATEDYLESLNKADIYISDYSSLLPEFFITQKPVILYNRGFNDSEFYKETKIMYNAIYKENTEQGLLSRLESLLNGNDEMFENRVLAIKEFLGDDDLNASQKILKAIKDDYFKK